MLTPDVILMLTHVIFDHAKNVFMSTPDISWSVPDRYVSISTPYIYEPDICVFISTPDIYVPDTCIDVDTRYL